MSFTALLSFTNELVNELPRVEDQMLRHFGTDPFCGAVERLLATGTNN